MELGGEGLRTLSMDHHGLVAATCKDLGIVERINKRIKCQDDRRVVSTGHAVVAMILNGLGFSNRRLYLTHQFFANKPIASLLGADIQASDITDYTLGHALDEISSYGSSKLFGEVAYEVALENDLLDHVNHLDTTSISVHGSYATEEDSEAGVIELRHGHSKDYRPDLKQAVLSLVVNGPSAMPIFMEGLNGNSSDKKSFHETIKKVEGFKQQLNLDKEFKWVADSALYSEDKLLRGNDYLWLTRVPETIKAAKGLVSLSDSRVDWELLEDGYKVAEFYSEHGGVEQRWVLVHSEQAYQRESKTLERKLTSKESVLEKALWHLGNQVFGCEKDAQSACDNLRKKHLLHTIDYRIIPVMKYAKAGKPRKGETQVIVGYKIAGKFSRNQTEIDILLNRKGRFILATNDMDKENYSAKQILRSYKGQQKVESGFRFLKDPWFMLDSIFLKSPKRIEALMMVMTLCLMVYNLAQFRLREALKEKNETLPNQLNKPIQNPTLRWIFQIMEGVGVVQFYQDKIERPIKEIITNIDEIRKKIIRLFGDTACQIYGLIQKNTTQVLGM